MHKSAVITTTRRIFFHGAKTRFVRLQIIVNLFMSINTKLKRLRTIIKKGETIFFNALSLTFRLVVLSIESTFGTQINDSSKSTDSHQELFIINSSKFFSLHQGTNETKGKRFLRLNCLNQRSASRHSLALLKPSYFKTIFLKPRLRR